MFTTGFSVQGSSLKLLRSGDRGVITCINPVETEVAQKLKKMGCVLGQTIALEQRFPRFIVRVGAHRCALDDLSINAIYVRVTS
jgi:ferrous iron transport protein A